MLRPMYALYFGGMGAQGRELPPRTSPCAWATSDEAKQIQDLYLDGKKDEAAAAVPTTLVEELALIGPEDKVRDDLDAWRDSIVTTLLVGGRCSTDAILDAARGATGPEADAETHAATTLAFVAVLRTL